jgi:hypothetical protein
LASPAPDARNGRTAGVPRGTIGSRVAPASAGKRGLRAWFRATRERRPLHVQRWRASPADQCASEVQQRAVQAGLAFPADAEPAEVVQPRERPLHNPADASETRAMLGGAPRDHRLHAAESEARGGTCHGRSSDRRSPGPGAGEAGRVCLRWRRFHRRAGAAASRYCDFRRLERRPAARDEGRRLGDVWNQCGRDQPATGQSVIRLEAHEYGCRLPRRPTSQAVRRR